MSNHEPETREQQAMREAGHTDVLRVDARLFVAAFFTLLVTVAGLELRLEGSGSGSAWRELGTAPGKAWRQLRDSGPVAANRQIMLATTGFEDALSERSLVARKLRPEIQWNLTRRLNTGTESVVRGRKGWLYFRPAVDHLTGPGFLEPAVLARRAFGGPTWKAAPQSDPLPAIADFAAQLAERGIGLIVVPTPVKAAIHPEGLASGLDAHLPLENPSFGLFLNRLREMDIPVYAPGELLARARREKPWAQFLRTDTHWTPQAMEAAAEGLASFISGQAVLSEGRGATYTRREVWVRGRGDLAALLRLPLGRDLFAPELARTQQVLRAGGELWKPDASADVLVLGDSFTNIYSQPDLGFGEGAGFAEQLSYYLGRPVDKLAVNAGGPTALRARLATDFVGGRDHLAGKRLVVYQFSERELSSGDWSLVDLSLDRAESATATKRAPVRARRSREALPARGFVVWESNRSGDWRIWTRRLEGSAEGQISPDEGERQHCCAHLSPNGGQVAYLSRLVPKDQYPELEVAGELRVRRLDGRGERTLVKDARPYGWGNRAVVWRNNRELVYVGAEGRTYLLDTTTGRASALTDEPRTKLAWLMDASLRHAVNGSPSFSSYDADAKRISEGERWPGCEPYFSHDGRFGFWVERAGGPVKFVELSSGRTGTVLENLDPRIPGDKRYAYFPMLSRDGRMFAFGASAGDHDHFRSNYDIFVAPLDPASLRMLGRPQRVTSHPGVDRYPDVHVESLDVARWATELPPVALGGANPPPIAAGPIEARATLGSCSRVPSLREISPYRAALIVCDWELVELLSGESKKGRLRVAHWGLRDGERQPIGSVAPGFTTRLSLAPLVGAKQTEGYPVFDTLPRAPVLPIYYAREP